MKKTFLIVVLSLVAQLAYAGIQPADTAYANHDPDGICLRAGRPATSPWLSCVDSLTASFFGCDNGEEALIEPCKDAAVERYFNPPDDPPDDDDPDNDFPPDGPIITDDLTLSEPGTLEVNNVSFGCAERGVGGDIDSPLLCEFIRYANFLSLGVVVVASITIAVSGVQYTMSRGEPAKAAQAVSRIVTVAMGLLVYVFGWAFLNWLIPGGAF